MNNVGTTAQIVTIASSLRYIGPMRTRLLAISLLLLAAACGGTDTTGSSAPAATVASSAPQTAGSPDSTSAPDSTENPSATAAPTTEALRAEGPAAPSFVTTLSDGSQFDMGAHDKPVYLVFWAEW